MARAARDELLQHQPGTGARAGLVGVIAAPPGWPATEVLRSPLPLVHGVVSLAISGYPGGRGELARRLERARHDRRAGWRRRARGRARTASTCPRADAAGRRADPGTGTESRRSRPCSARKIAPGVVGREQDARLTDMLGETQQAAQHPVRVGRAGLPEEASGQVTGTRGGSPRSLVHPVDRHAHPPQTTDDAQAAVMHDVRIELEDDRRRAGVDWVLIASHRGASMRLDAGPEISPCQASVRP